MILAESVSIVEDTVGFHSIDVLVGKGTLVGRQVMMGVLIMPVGLLAGVDKDPTELMSDSTVLEKL